MSDSAPTDVRLAEYAALREEIQSRSGLQQTLIGVNITAIGALGGVVLSTETPPSALLLLPPICSTLGFLWLDHHGTIMQIGRYIGDKLWIWQPSWQNVHGRDRKPIWFWLPYGLIWTGPSIAALIAVPVASHLHSLWWLWAVDAALVLAFFAIFVNRAIRDTRQLREPDCVIDSCQCTAGSRSAAT
jgi:hypothetical protein